MKHRLIGILLLSSIIVFSCQKEEKAKKYEADTLQAMSLLGDSLTIPQRSEGQLEKLKANLKEAQTNFDSEASEMSTIWLGRRHAYLYDYKKAIQIFSEGIKNFPDSYKLYRHRGHRHISLRQFDNAIEDYEKAHQLMKKGVMEIEPDGAPNKMNIPLSNTQFNILYHYGLAHYLKGEFEKAEAIYKECMEYSDNPDLLVGTTDWLYMTLRRQGKTDEAKALLQSIDSSMEIIENDSYLKRLLMYKGEYSADDLLKTSGDDAALSLATQGYGLANWHLYNGDTTQAKAILEQVVSGSSWSAFGFIAAEADLARLNN